MLFSAVKIAHFYFVALQHKTVFWTVYGIFDYPQISVELSIHFAVVGLEQMVLDFFVADFVVCRMGCPFFQTDQSVCVHF